jgi:alpha-amylase
LKTEESDVRNVFQEWITKLVSDYGSKFAQLLLATFILTDIVDGIRIDTAKNVERSFFPEFAKASNVFCTGEVLDGAPSAVCPYTQELDSILNYPVCVISACICLIPTYERTGTIS